MRIMDLFQLIKRNQPSRTDEIIEQYASHVLGQMAVDGCSAPHLRPVRASYYEPRHSSSIGWDVTLYAYYDADGYRLTQAFESSTYAHLDLIYRYGGASDQELRWSDAMAAACSEYCAQFGERCVNRKGEAVRQRLSQALTMLANPARLTETLANDSHLIPRY